MPLDTPFSASLSKQDFELKNSTLQSILDLCREIQPQLARLPPNDLEWKLPQQCDYLKSFVAGSYESPIVLIQHDRNDILFVADGQRRVETLLAFVNGRVPWIDDNGRERYFVEPTESVDQTSEESLKSLHESDRELFLQKRVDFVSIQVKDDAGVENALYHIRYTHTLCPSFHWTQNDAWSERLSAILDGCPGLNDLLLWTGMNRIRNRDTFLICLLMSTKALRSGSRDCEQLLVTQQDCQRTIEELGDLQPVEKARLARMSKRLAKVGLAFTKEEYPGLGMSREIMLSDASVHPIEIIAMALLVLFTLDSSEPEVLKRSTAMIREVRKKPGRLRLDQGNWNLYRKWFPSNDAIDLPKPVSSSAVDQPAAAIATAGEGTLMIDITQIIMSSDTVETAPPEYRNPDPAPISTQPAQPPASAGTNGDVRTSAISQPEDVHREDVAPAAAKSPIIISSEAGNVGTISSTPIVTATEARPSANGHGDSATAAPAREVASTGGDFGRKMGDTVQNLLNGNGAATEQAPVSSQRTSSDHPPASAPGMPSKNIGQSRDHPKTAPSTQKKPGNSTENRNSRISVDLISDKTPDSDTASTSTPGISLSDRILQKRRRQAEAEALRSKAASIATALSTNPAVDIPDISLTAQGPSNTKASKDQSRSMNEMPSTAPNAAISLADDDVEIISYKQIPPEKRKGPGSDGPDADRPKLKKKKRDKNKPMGSILADWVE